MSKIIQLSNQTRKIIDQIYINSQEADRVRKLENQAAIKIQSWYRSKRLRAYIKNLRSSAIRIQRCWRGHKGRQTYRYALDDQVKLMRLKYYSDSAILIQKNWRGFYSRKYLFNYYKRKAYLNVIQQKNEIVLNELKEYKEYMERQQEEKKNMLKYKRLEENAKRNHYLISTKQIPGVFNSPYKPAPADMEYLMRNVKLDPPEKHDFYVKSIKDNKFESITLPEGLPPLNLKPQGPFRDPLIVRKQRYRPFSPTLRVEHDFESVEKSRIKMKEEEWCGRLHDKIFYPIEKTIYKKPYEPLMLTRTKYALPEYGRKYFREECDPKDYADPQGNAFKSQVPPIPEFHKLNRTYVDAHYYY